MGVVEGLQQFGAIFYPGFEADAGAGWRDIREIEYGQLLESVGTVFELSRC